MFGVAPDLVRRFAPRWDEYMHYLYLPVAMPAIGGIRLPQRLLFLKELITEIMLAENWWDGYYNAGYVYVTARRGYATPGNPLNRPGWHTDGFGTEDVNYIWTDRYPTRFALGAFKDISTDHVRSAEQFEEQAPGMEIITYEPGSLLRLDPFVVHCTPEIPAPGGERSFLKISLSKQRYNLRGNSHNYGLPYAWKMWDRAEVRNDPAYAGGDTGPQ